MELEHGTDLFPTHFQNLSPAQQVRMATQISQQSSYLKKRPFAHSASNASKLVARMVQSKGEDDSEFCWGLSFDPTFIANLAREGFLPMSGQIFADLICLLPKLHVQRCLMVNLQDIKIGNGARKRAKHFDFTVDQAMNEVIKGCQVQHGKHCWFYAPLTKAYRHIQQLNSSGGLQGVRLHSCELWDNKTGKLVAGELGYAVGGIYTSLSGYREPGSKSAGTIQCCCTAIMLRRVGFLVWDLGMGMDYKKKLGAEDCERSIFLAHLHRCRDHTNIALLCPEKIDANELFQWHKTDVASTNTTKLKSTSEDKSEDTTAPTTIDSKK